MDPIDVDDADDDDAYAATIDALIAARARDGDAGGDAGAATTANDRDDTDESNEDSGNDDDDDDDGREHDLAHGIVSALGRAHVVRSYGEAVAGAGRGEALEVVKISKTMDDDSWGAADAFTSASDAGEAGEKSATSRCGPWRAPSPGTGWNCSEMTIWGRFGKSDGAQPHLVNIQFQHKAQLSELALWCEFKMDESYTPSMISIRAGASCHDLREIRCVSVEQPNGWVRIKLTRESSVTASPYLRAYFVQIAILANHQNGRDTHVRQIKLFGPRRDQARMLGHSMQLDLQTPEFRQYGGVR